VAGKELPQRLLGRYQTVLPSGSVADLLAFLLWTSPAKMRPKVDLSTPRRASSARRASGKRSQRCRSTYLAILPTRGLESLPFNVATSSRSFSSVFDNGLPQGKWDFIKDGKLDGLISTRAVAEATGIPYGSGGDNVVHGLSQVVPRRSKFTDRKSEETGSCSPRFGIYAWSIP
jgi:hypothetical protein